MFMNTDIDIFKCNLEMQNCCNLIKVDKTFILYFPKKGRIIFSMLFGVWMTVGIENKERNCTSCDDLGCALMLQLTY